MNPILNALNVEKKVNNGPIDLTPFFFASAVQLSIKK
jgi:hypothetical protein